MPSLDELVQQFEATRELYLSVPVEIYCVIDGPKPDFWPLYLPSPIGQDIDCQTLWPVPDKNAPRFDFDEEPQEEPPIGPYHHISALSKNKQAIIDFIELAHEAGIELPENERERASIPPNTPSKIRWIFWLIHTLKDQTRPKYIEVEDRIDRENTHSLTYTIQDAFLASKVAIGQAKFPTSKQPVKKTSKAQTAVVEAMRLIKDHPDWSDRKIAKQAGVSASTLSRSKIYQRASLYARQQGYEISRGYRDLESGQIEGID